MTYAYRYIARGHIAVTRKLLLRTYWNKVNLRTAYQFQKITCFDVLEETDEMSDVIHIDTVENEHTPQICYMSVQYVHNGKRIIAILLGLPYIHGNTEHRTTHVMVSVNHCVHLQQEELFLMVIAFFELFHLHLLVHRNIMKFAYWLQHT